jgi:phenylacetate-coenzyme A ligase PaaK-like adenylate-forming protein
VLETAVAQLRFAASLLLGRSFAPWSLDLLVAAARETQREFGSVGPEAAEFIGGPALDEETRREIAFKRFRTQARRAARETAHYAEVFRGLHVDPARLDSADLTRVPVTTKDALRDDPDAFVRRGARSTVRATTTGTTGRPTCVCFSTAELRAYAALSALGLLTRREVLPEDVVQISTSSSALLGNLAFAGGAVRVGALTSQTGLVDPERTLALLAEKRRVPGKKSRVSVLSTYPSYLGQLVEAAPALGYRAADFGLERVFVGGEIVTEGLKDRARRIFGEVQFVESYAMTETFPFGGSVCAEGHLHFEVSAGLLEVLNVDTGAAARPGEAGTIVATPFAPYRETTILLRYDTEDVVRPIMDALVCPLRALPATSNLLGKRRLAVRHDAGWTYPREVLEALEALDVVPLPARCGWWASGHGVTVEVAVREASSAVRRAIGQALEKRGVPVRKVELVTMPSELQRPYPHRADLRERQFEAVRS